MDVIEIDAATNRGIDEIRELRDAARYRPARDKYKIYILDEAHQITDAAFNALLKTLEEPPDHIVFMMATTQPEDIPQTVRSRCQHFSFRAVNLRDILGELRSIAASEELDVDDAALNIVAEAGDGSMRDALSVMDQAIASAPQVNGRPSLHATQIRELLGTVSNIVFERMLEAIDAGRTADLITSANELLDAGNSPAQLARQLVRYLRSTLFAKILHLAPESTENAGADLLQISVDERRRAARSAQLFSEEELTRFLQVMLRTFNELGYRQEQRLHFELGLLKLLHLRRLLPMEELLSQLPTSKTPTSSSTRTVLPASPLQVAVPRVEPGSVATQTSKREPFSPFQADQRRRAEHETSPAPVSPTASTRAAERPLPSVTGIGEAGGAPRVEARGDANPASLPSEPAPAVRAAVPQSTASVPEAAPESAGSAHPTAVAEAGTEDDVDRLRARVLRALSESKGQSSAADALAEAEWSIDGDVVRAQTTFSKSMLGVLLNAEAQQLIRRALAEEAGGRWRFEALPGRAGEVAAEAKAAKPRAARSGSAQAKAQEHPIVQQAQRLFDAEIRNVIDLSGSK